MRVATDDGVGIDHPRQLTQTLYGRVWTEMLLVRDRTPVSKEDMQTFRMHLPLLGEGA
jgi:hypothetical protein